MTKDAGRSHHRVRYQGVKRAIYSPGRPPGSVWLPPMGNLIALSPGKKMTGLCFVSDYLPLAVKPAGRSQLIACCLLAIKFDRH